MPGKRALTPVFASKLLSTHKYTRKRYWILGRESRGFGTNASKRLGSLFYHIPFALRHFCGDVSLRREKRGESVYTVVQKAYCACCLLLIEAVSLDLTPIPYYRWKTFVPDGFYPGLRRSSLFLGIPGLFHGQKLPIHRAYSVRVSVKLQLQCLHTYQVRIE